MNFLAICQRARQEMAVSGTGPSTVVAQTGEMKRVCDWVASAYLDICAEHEDWNFLQSSFTVNTVIGQEAYTPTSCTDSVLSAAIGSATVGAFGRWVEGSLRIYKQSAGIAAQHNLFPLAYDWFREQYQLVAPANNQPSEFTVRPRDKAILCGPKPDDVYVITGDYYRVAVPLALDADTPLLPERFHMAIVWRAVRMYAQYEEAGGIYAASNIEYKRIHRSLLLDQLPRMQLGSSLV